MKIAFSKMNTARLETLRERLIEKTINVTNWRQKDKNRFRNLVVICNILADREEIRNTAQEGLTLSERYQNGMFDPLDRMLVKVIPPWNKKTKQINNDKKEFTPNRVDTETPSGKGYQAHGKKLQNQNRTWTRKA